MAQNFRRYTASSIGTTGTTIYTSSSYATIIGISVANIATSGVNATVQIYNGTTTINLVYVAPVPAGSALQVLDGGAKFVMSSGDAIIVKSDTTSSLDVWVSSVDSIST
jgi:hypothetical protein